MAGFNWFWKALGGKQGRNQKRSVGLVARAAELEPQVQALSDADLAAKTASLRAHATQVWVGDGGVSMVNPRAATGAVDASGDARGVWALSNLICQPITPAEHYRLGTAGADLAAVFAGEKTWDELRRDSAAASTAPAASAGAPADTEGASR